MKSINMWLNRLEENKFRDCINCPIRVIVAIIDNGIHDDIRSFIENKIDNELRHIVLWGDSANALEDFLDTIIEDKGLYEIVTTAHRDDSADDMAYFISKAIVECDDNFCFTLIFSEDSEKPDDFLSAIGRVDRIKLISCSR